MFSLKKYLLKKIARITKVVLGLDNKVVEPGTLNHRIMRELDKDIRRIDKAHYDIYRQEIAQSKQARKIRKLQEDLIHKKNIAQQRRVNATQWFNQGPNAMIHESQWGYHSINEDHFKKLKYIRKHIFEELYKLNAYMRWLAKSPHNRIRIRRTTEVFDNDKKFTYVSKRGPILPPPLGTLFTRISQQYPSVEKETKQIFGSIHYDERLDRYLYIYCGDIIRDYEEVRQPIDLQKFVVFPLTSIKDINILHEECRVLDRGLYLQKGD